jgi:glycosyltransferase involved in cell wall biosynthesis
MKPSLSPQISVLMPVYQPNPAWLRAAIESLNAQTYPHWQLVLSLDGDDPATLNAADVAQDSLTKGHPLIVVRGKRSGISSALNRGLAACNTPYTARLDADDLCRPSRLLQQWQLLEHEPKLVACGMQIKGIDANGNQINQRLHRYPTTPTATLLVGAIFNTPSAHPVLMVRTDQAKRIDGYRAFPCMEDYDLMARLCRNGDITNLLDVGLDYRMHKGQHSRQVRPMRSHLLAARWMFLQQLCYKQPVAVVFATVPLLLFIMGPRGEHGIRRLAGRWAAKAKKFIEGQSGLRLRRRQKE